MRPDPTKISNNPYPVNPLGFLIGSFLGVSEHSVIQSDLKHHLISESLPTVVHPLWHPRLASLPLFLDIWRGLDKTQAASIVDLPAQHTAGADPDSRILEVLCGRDLASGHLGDVLVAAQLSGWPGERRF